ncbi:tetratricopeptide repeat protein [Avibacterium gallinarum]|uniref:tetratricopeptide repeat protein n=1 Tax=Avibacterium gallinarum TaxID=755 RepID=UPI0039FC61D7
MDSGGFIMSIFGRQQTNSLHQMERSQQKESTSKQIFAERKNGNLDQAYQMSLDAMKQGYDEWVEKAYAWCLIDLIKRDVKLPNSEMLPIYIEQLEQIEVNQSDDILFKHKKCALNLCDPLQPQIQQAKELSKNQQYHQAVNLYLRLLKQRPHDIDLQTSFAWDLYRLAKIALEQKPIKIENFKRYFYEYLRLNTEKPSSLHHCYLWIALKLLNIEKISEVENIDFSDFMMQWKIVHLLHEDYQPSYYEDRNGEKRENLPLALKVFRAILKSGLAHKNQRALTVLLPEIEKQSTQIRSDLVWLKWDLAKTYHFLGDNERSQDLILKLLKIKSNEYWLWDFLGDIYQEQQDMSLACYAKALLNQKDIGFVYKIKIKLTKLFIAQKEYEKAKCELDEIINYKNSKGEKIPDEVGNLISEPWYNDTKATDSNQNIYAQNAPIAESLLYQDLPWIKAVLGDVFENNGRKSRKLFLSLDKVPLEIAIPDNKITLANKKVNTAIQIKGEMQQGRFHLYTIAERLDQDDIFPSYQAVVTYINQEKKMVNCLVDKDFDFAIPLTEIKFNVNVLDVLDVTLSTHTTKEGKKRFKAHQINLSNKSIPTHLLKEFDQSVRISSGNGFTNNDIFIPKDLVSAHNILNNAQVNGLALLSLDKKKNQWGWRAIKIMDVKDSYDDSGSAQDDD